jgi:serine/threonine protein kinase/Tfp pilus assembly protein PilF
LILLINNRFEGRFQDQSRRPVLEAESGAGMEPTFSAHKDDAHPSTEMLQRFCRGAIEDDRLMAELEEHLFSCRSCGDAVAQLGLHNSELRLAEAWASSGSVFLTPTNRYEVLEEIGRGGLGVVYKARQADLDRVLALKVLISGRRASAVELARFRREAHAMAQLNHPQIVNVFDFGEQDGSLYLAMEFVDGPTLAQFLSQGLIETATAAVWVRDLARAMAFAHERSIFHRDLKPHNILLSRNGTSEDAHSLIPKIVDFGLAKFDSEELFQTRTGATLGTPAYLAPEMIGTPSDQLVSPTIDVYGLGTVLYECLTGRPPFIGSTQLEILTAVAESEPAAVQSLRKNVPRDLAIICHRCLARRPSDRFQSATELADDLHRFLLGLPIHSRSVSNLERASRWCRRNPWKAVAIGLIGLALLAVPTAAAYHNAQLRSEKLKAQNRYEMTRATMWKMLNLLNQESSHSIPQVAELASAQVAESLLLFDELAAVNPSGESQLDVAKMRIFAGSLAVVLGQPDQAKTHLERAIAICETWLSSPDWGDAFAEQMAAALNKLAISYADSPDSAKRIPLLERALSIHRELASRNQNDQASRGQVAWSLINLGSVHQLLSDFQSAIKSFEEAIQICDELIEEDFQTLENRKTASGCRINLATIQLQLGETKTAEKNFRLALQELKLILKKFPNEKSIVQNVSTGLLNFSNCLQANGQTEEALNACEDARHLLLGALKLEPKHALLKQNLFLVTANRAHLLSTCERYSEAVHAWQAAIEITSDPAMNLYCRQLRNICLVKMGDPDRAVVELNQVEEKATQPNEKFLQALGWALAAKAKSERESADPTVQTDLGQAEWAGRAWDLLQQLQSTGQLSAANYREHLLDKDWSEVRRQLSPGTWDKFIEQISKDLGR